MDYNQHLSATPLALPPLKLSPLKVLDSSSLLFLVKWAGCETDKKQGAWFLPC